MPTAWMRWSSAFIRLTTRCASSRRAGRYKERQGGRGDGLCADTNPEQPTAGGAVAAENAAALLRADGGGAGIAAGQGRIPRGGNQRAVAGVHDCDCDG